MTYLDGGVLSKVKIHKAGPASERFNILVVSEGYRYDQLDQFAADARDFSDRLFETPPFDGHKCTINVSRLDVWSYDAGADDPYFPPDCLGDGATPRTFFDATFCAYGIARLIWVDHALVEWVRYWYSPEAHQVVVLVNSSKEGGNGDTFPTVSKGNGWDWPKVAIHELGHTAFHLGDEYDFLKRCDDGNGTYAGPPPSWPNVAQDVTRAGLKWGALVDPATPLPTYPNPDCATCNDVPSPQPPGTIGAFEGAGLYHCGLYRPEETCIMRFADDFCAVCSAVLEFELAPFRPKCLAPVFPPSEGIWCWLKKVGLAASLMIPMGGPSQCKLRRTLFRIEHCESGNENPCIDLGGRAPLPVTPAYEAYGAVPTDP